MLFIKAVSSLLILTRLVIKASYKFYVEENGLCSTDCDGSLINPFPDLITALKMIDNSEFFLAQKSDEVRIIIMKTATSPVYSDEVDPYNHLNFWRLFEMKNNVNLTIISNSDRADVNLNKDFFLIKMSKGVITFTNVSFIGMKSVEMLSNQMNVNNKFIDITGEGDTNINFINCRFVNKFSFPSYGYVYSNLIYFKQQNNLSIVPREIILNFLSVEFLDNFFPFGMIRFEIIDEVLPKINSKINIRDSSFLNYYFMAEPAELNTEAFSQFCITIYNNCSLELLNVKITNCIRFLLARENNTVYINKTLIRSTLLDSKKPELFYFHTKNIVKFSEISFMEYYLEGRDDLVNAEPDSSIVGNVYDVIGLADNERVQACIKFYTENNAELRLVTIDDLYIIKKANLYFAFLCTEYKNLIKIEDSIFKNIIIDSLSKFGITLMFLFLDTNTIYFNGNKIINLTANTFSIALCIGIVAENSFKIKNSYLQNLNFKHKARQDEVIEFYGKVGLFGDYNDNLFVLKTEKIKASCFISSLYGNKLTVENGTFKDVYCLSSCLLDAFILNLVIIENFQLQSVESELLSSSYSFQVLNIISFKNCSFLDGKSMAGVIFNYVENIIYIEKCRFAGNLAFSFIGKRIDTNMAIAGDLYLGHNNRLIIENTVLTDSQSDQYGGSITLFFRNNVSILTSNFQKIQSTNKNNRGGVFIAFERNNISFFRTNFTSNIGNIGGVGFADEFNIIIIDNCYFTNNFAMIAGLVYLHIKNILLIKGSFVINNEASENGLFCLESVDNTVHINNSIFKGNRAKLRECLIFIQVNSNLTMQQVQVEYGFLGMSSLIWAKEKINLTFLNCTITKAGDVFSLIWIWNNCFVLMNNLSFGDIDTFPLYLNTNNMIYIYSCNFKNSKPSKQGTGLIFVEGWNTVYCFNSNFSNIVGGEGIIFKIFFSNKISVLSCTFFNINGENPGGLFFVYTDNYFNISFSNFSLLEGINVNSFLANIFNDNSLILTNNVFSGYLTPILGSSSFLLVDGIQNNIELRNLNITLRKQKSRLEKLFFLTVLGKSNIIFIFHSNVNLFNFSTGIRIYGENLFAIDHSIVYDCLLEYGFLELIRLHSIFISFTYFFKNKVDTADSFIINFEKVVYSHFLGVNVKNEEGFLRAFASTVNIDQSLFTYSQIIRGELPFFSCSNSSLNMNKTNFIAIHNNQLSNIFLFGSSLMLWGNKFLFNKGKYGGVLFFYWSFNITILRNEFIYNEAVSGAVFFSEDSWNIFISYNRFFFNRARRKFDGSENLEDGKAGCFYLRETGILNNSILLITKNNFSKNSAEIGGVYFFEGTDLILGIINLIKDVDNIYKSNKMKYYGPIYATSIRKLQVNEVEPFKVADIKVTLKDAVKFTNDTEKCFIKIYALDYFGQIIYGIKETNVFKDRSVYFAGKHGKYSILFLARSSFICLNRISILYNEKIFRFVIDRPYNFYFSTFDLFPKYNNSNKGIILTQTITIDFLLSYCGEGEYLDSEKMNCLPCEPNFFSFSKDVLRPSTCLNCESYNFYCYGGRNLSPKKGFWRLDSSSTNFFKCPLKDACLGDINMLGSTSNQIIGESYLVTTPTGACAFGYRGPLCNSCKRGFAKSDEKRCVPCGNLFTILGYVFQNIAKLFVFGFMIYKALSLCKSLKLRNEDNNLILSNFLIKILIGHLQFARLILIIFTVDYTDIVIEVFNYLTKIITTGPSMTTSFECMGVNLAIPSKYLHTIILILLPVIAAFLLRYFNIGTLKKACEGLGMRRKSVKIRRGKSKFLVSLLRFDSSWISIISICIMLFFDQIMIELLSYFPEINLGDRNRPDHRLLTDFEISTNEGHLVNWKIFFVAPFILIYLIVTPIMIFFKIFKYKRLGFLQDPRTLFRYGYFYFAYDDKFYFYELIYVCRKSILIFIDVFCAPLFDLGKSFNDPIAFLTVLMILFMTSAVFSKIYKPFENQRFKILNDVEFSSFIVQALTCSLCCLSLSLNIEEVEFDSQLRDTVRVASLVLGALLNLYFISLWCFHYWKVQAKPLLVAFWVYFKKRFHRKKKVPKKININLEDKTYQIQDSSDDRHPQFIHLNFGSLSPPSRMKLKKKLDHSEVLITLLNKENILLKKEIERLKNMVNELQKDDRNRSYSVSSEEKFSKEIMVSKPVKEVNEGQLVPNGEFEQGLNLEYKQSLNLRGDPKLILSVSSSQERGDNVPENVNLEFFIDHDHFKAEMLGTSCKNYYMAVTCILSEEIYNSILKIEKIHYHSCSSKTIAFKGAHIADSKELKFYLRGIEFKTVIGLIDVILSLRIRNLNDSEERIIIKLTLSLLDFLKPLNADDYPDQKNGNEEECDETTLRTYEEFSVEYIEDLKKLRLIENRENITDFWALRLLTEDLNIFFILRKMDNKKTLLLKTSKNEYLNSLYLSFDKILSSW